MHIIAFNKQDVETYFSRNLNDMTLVAEYLCANYERPMNIVEYSYEYQLESEKLLSSMPIKTEKIVEDIFERSKCTAIFVSQRNEFTYVTFCAYDKKNEIGVLYVTPSTEVLSIKDLFSSTYYSELIKVSPNWFKYVSIRENE